MSSHAEKVKKPIYKKWWFWLIIVIIIIAIAGASGGNNTTTNANTVNATQEEQLKSIEDNKANEEEDVPKEYENALNKAETYSEIMHMSKKGIYNQLTSEVEGFTDEAAQYAIDNIKADWKANALAKAKDYQDTMSMSKQGVYNQLTSDVEGFTEEEAQYAIDNLED